MPGPERSKLDEYARKRRFDETPEPSGEAAGADADGENRFVVHEHHARRLHWDLRLEREGVLVSWAVPNGIPDDPARNRKAIHTEDHPLDYIDFAGTIPEGNYGAGEIGVWDHGTYETQKWRKDEVMIVFHGERLTGRYVLFRAGKDEKDWMIHRMDPAVDPDAEPIPEFIAPMLAKMTALPHDTAGWAFEIKWDGVRALARSEPGRLALLSRNGNDITGGYPELRALNRALGSHSAVLDGEIIAFDDDGRPSFEALQGRMHVRGESAVRRLAESSPVSYMIFDLLWLDGHSLMGLPYGERREKLDALGLGAERWQVPAFHQGDGAGLLAATRELGLEGIVAKRLDSRYLPGKRYWAKIKNYRRQEVVIGGWTHGRGGRVNALGALQVGVHDTDGRLLYAGGVGTGFDAAELARVQDLLAPLARDSSPFSGRATPKGTNFVEPTLVCEVEFSEWTRAGTLRQASYKGLREDKTAAEVVRERLEEVPDEPEPPAATNAAGDPASSAPDAPDLPDADALDIRALVDAGRAVRDGVEVDVDGRTLKLTNLDKVLYPETGFTKLDVITYYASIAPVLLGHLAGRPLTLKRYPNGVAAQHFYEKNSPSHRPEWVQTARLATDRGKGTIAYTLVSERATLVWLANLADLELHPSLARAEEIKRPTTLAFDLDPGPPATVVECCDVALLLRELFDQLGLNAYAKTSGSKGMQVYVPLNVEAADYEETRPLAHAVAGLLERRHGDLIVSEMTKAKRSGKVFIDWSQNARHKTTVCVYSLRGTPEPRVSTPLTWAEVEACAQSRLAEDLVFGPADVLGRVAAGGDLFAGVLSDRQPLPNLGQ